ncbi:MAG: lasso peptide biosynthesis B2 protein, partial [Nitrospirae bacterium]|nr:lasso peptide biosynthesis B2 protein [Nitrospirota bacterium]
LFKRSSAVAVARDRNTSLPAERIAWAIHVASRYLPGTGNCLVQALATQGLLARHGNPACVRIGVANDEDGRFKAHAWVECDGTIVIGGVGVSQYTALPRWEIQR